jgi:hypothetical protein
VKYVRVAFLIIGVAALVIHFGFVGIYLFPDNPIKHQFKYELQSYVNPFFSQSWNLFSPTPINTNMTLLVQFKTFSGAKYDSTEWVDIYQPLIEEKRRNFWSPSQRLSKFMTSSMQSVIENSRTYIRAIKEDSLLARDSVKADSAYNVYMANTFGNQSIIQYSQYVFKKLLSNRDIRSLDSVFVRYEIFDSKFPRFSKRELDFFDLKNYAFSKITSSYYKLGLNTIAENE